MKSKTTSKPKSDSSDLDPSEINESYDEFNAIMLPISRTMSKSPSSDEGIEPDSDLKSLHQVPGPWSLDSSLSNADDDCCRRDSNNSTSSLGQRRKSRAKVTRCCSSDSAVISDDDQNKGKYI